MAVKLCRTKSYSLCVFTEIGDANKHGMKVKYSKPISAFGGLNFVIQELDKRGIGRLLNSSLPALPAQSKFDWRNILYSYWSVFLCGGDCAEDLSGNFKSSLSQSPNLSLPSADRVLSRMKDLAMPASFFESARGKRPHHFALNAPLNELNLVILERLFGLSKQKATLDYDNTLCLNNKKDAQKTYTMEWGYAPGAAFIGPLLVYVENRNGCNNASTLQYETLERMFNQLESHGIKTEKFRADSASFTTKCIEVISRHSEKFYIKARMSETLDRIISEVPVWSKVKGAQDELYRGETLAIPFQRELRKGGMLKENPKEYRFIVTKAPRKDGQINVFTGEANHYSVIITSDMTSTADEIVCFYNQRGKTEREFDVLKNDFGWNHLPFSKLEENQVYLLITGICRNIFHYIITLFSHKFEGLNPTFRLKKFIFRFISIPGQWKWRSRRWELTLYGQINFKT